MCGVSLTVAIWHSRHDWWPIKTRDGLAADETAWYGLFGANLVVDEHTVERSPEQELALSNMK